MPSRAGLFPLCIRAFQLRGRRGRIAAMTRKTSLLVVDDDPRVRAMLPEYLGDHGFAVRAVADGAAMRAELERELPDLVLLDLRLPGEDGLTLAR